jgi:sterol desaturase/sphingolipid hydroxylase (fatty acid hydroxylase superfamily)
MFLQESLEKRGATYGRLHSLFQPSLRTHMLPSLVDVLTDPVSIVVFAIYGALILVEQLRPARTLPHIPYWPLKGLAAFAIYFLISTYLPYVWGSYLAPLMIIDLSAIGTVWGVILGVLVYEFGAYWWHRGMHSSMFMWRAFHQMHHSAERLDTFSAFWFSPLDTVGWTLVFSVAFAVVGFSPDVVVMCVYITTFLAVFQHSNIRTPRWLGYIIQRPESHSMHHATDFHHGNYADLPVFDIIFGTFHNPADFAKETGFYQGASSRVVAMTFGIDVSEAR